MRGRTVFVMDTKPTTVVKISQPADILGVLPYRLGFHPTESIVVVCLAGSRRRDVLVMRLDLAAEEDDKAVARDLAERAGEVGPGAVVLACYTEAKPAALERLAREKLAGLIGVEMKNRGIEVVDALLVSKARWWSYLCSDQVCCPEAGSPLPAELTPAARAFAAESVGQGAAVLADRAALARSVRPNSGPAAMLAREQGVELAAQGLVDQLEQGGVEAVREHVLGVLARLVSRQADGDVALPPVEVATVILGLRDKHIRDEVMTLVLDEQREALVGLLVALASSAEDCDAAPICTVLAWVAYAQGDGALANVAIERALDSDPNYELARLIEGGLEAMVSPTQVRRVAAQVRADLRRNRQ